MQIFKIKKLHLIIQTGESGYAAFGAALEFFVIDDKEEELECQQDDYNNQYIIVIIFLIIRRKNMCMMT